MENKSMGMLLGAFVMLIIGVSLVTVVAGQSNLVAEKTVVYQESHDLSSCMTPIGGDLEFDPTDCSYLVTNYPTSWKIEDCPLTSVTVGNGTMDFTLTTDYTVDAATGNVTIVNSTSTQIGYSNTTYVDYTYCGADYVNSSFGRTALDITIGLFAIALLLGAVGMFYAVMKQEGLTNL